MSDLINIKNNILDKINEINIRENQMKLKHVVLVDDNERYIFANKNTLVNYEMSEEISVVADIEETGSIIKSATPDIIFINDTVFPEHYDTVRKLKDEYPDSQYIYLINPSDYNVYSSFEQFTFMGKPISVSELKKILKL